MIGVDQLSTLFTGAIVPEASDPEGATGLPLPGLYALTAARYVDVHGLTLEQLAQVAVKNKTNGMDNERAHLRREPPTVEKVLDSRPIADPLTMLQCCPITDGAGALIIGAGRRTNRDVAVESSAMVSGKPWDQRHEDVWGFRSVERAGAAALEEAGRMIEEIDVFEIHDAFTIGEITTLEALGVADVGKGGDLAVSGHTPRDGRQPVNPSGGLLSRGHPLGATGTAQLAEVVWQLRGDAGPRQVSSHAVGMVETMGGGAAGMDGNACVVTILSI